MTNICKEFKNASNYIHTWFSKKPNVKEESFTDYFLYHLSESLPEFNYLEFSRFEEGRESGADFDFWIISRTEYFSLRIQAKKIYKTGNNFSALTYPEGTKKQITLLNSSSTFPLRPFYLFYNNFDNTSKCSRNNTGTFLTDAKELFTLVNSGITNVTRQNILDLSVPLECMFCCPLSFGMGDNLDGIKSFLQQYFPIDDNSNNSGFSDILPSYIELLLNKEVADEEWLRNYKENNLPKDVRRIVVLDIRNIEKDYR